MDFPSFSSLISQVWAFYKKNFKALFKIVLLTYLPILVVIVELLLAAVLFFVLKAMLGTLGAAVVTGVVGVAILIISMIALGSWTMAASITIVDNIGKGNMTLRQALSETRSKIWPLWVTGLLSMLIVFSGYLLFIIPGIVFSVWFSLISWIVVLEGVSGFDALIRSREYLRGFTLKVFLYGLGLQILLGIITSGPSVLFRNTDLSGIVSIYSFIIQFLVYPVSFVFTYFIYKFVKNANSAAAEKSQTKSKSMYKLGAVGGILIPIIFILIFFAIVLPKLNMLNSQFYQMPTPVPEEQQQIIDMGMI